MGQKFIGRNAEARREFAQKLIGKQAEVRPLMERVPQDVRNTEYYLPLPEYDIALWTYKTEEAPNG